VKAIILAGGLGKRLGLDIPKCLVKVGEKSLIKHIIDKLRLIGIKEIAVVIGHKGKEVKKSLGGGINYFWQKEQLGTAHAFLCAEDFIDEKYFLGMNGDIFFTDSLERFVKLHGPAIAAYWVEDASRFGRLYLKSGKLVEIKEKIPESVPGLINAGIYIFPRGIFEIIRKTPLSERGEYEITDTIKMLLKEGLHFKVYRLKGYWKDIATIYDLEEANKFLKILQNETRI
jgi:bifunctional UDP-N-acetylglucosamine pyrophosphorylase/glucosamine-1-phosphate N-acetyltransferase